MKQRLIDAEALKQEVLGWVVITDDDFGKGRFYERNVILGAIAEAPTIDPVKHGKWMLLGTNSHHYETSVEEKCSLCGRYVYRYDTQPQDNYCPSCGARMDGEK